MPLKLPEDEGHPVDRIIRNAMAEGQFDNLEGQGRPLPMDLSSNPWRPAFGLLKNAGFAPEWVETERAIEGARANAAAALDRYGEQRAEALAAIEGLRAHLEPAPDERVSSWWVRLRALQGRAPKPRGPVAGRLAAAIDELNTARDRTIRSHLRRLHAINGLVDRLNLVPPLRGSQHWREDVAGAARELAQRFPRALLAGGPGALAIEWVPGEVPAEWLRPPDRAEEASGRVRGEVQVEALVEYRHRRRGIR